MAALDNVIEQYRSQHGEPEYRYFKRLVVWSRDRRKGCHIVPIGDGEAVTKEEYEANCAETKRIRTEAFYGRWPRNYWEYHRKMIKDGWREVLIKDVQAAVT